MKNQYSSFFPCIRLFIIFNVNKITLPAERKGSEHWIFKQCKCCTERTGSLNVSPKVEKWTKQSSKLYFDSNCFQKYRLWKDFFIRELLNRQFSLNLKVVSAFFLFSPQINRMLILRKFKKSHFYGFFVDFHENKIKPAPLRILQI